MIKKLSYMSIFCILGLLIGIALANVGGWQIDRPPTEAWFSGSAGDPGWNWMKAADKLIEGGMQLGTGKVFYVDSSVTTEGSGVSWESAKDTIDEAVNLCEDSRGDIIFVAQGHAETFLTQSLDVDIIGVTIIGCGTGSLRPTITFGHTAAEVAIGADNVTIKNMRFICSVTGVLMGMEVEDGVDYFHIEGCEFTSAGDAIGTDEFVEAINFVNNNIGCTIKNNVFNAEASGAAHAIFCDADTSRLSIVGNDIRGDYSVACIGGDTTAITDFLIMNNVLINGSLVADSGLNAVAAISLLNDSAGLIVGNFMGADTATDIMRSAIADDAVFIQNFVTDDDGDEYEGSIRSGTTAVTKSEDG